ncbi:MAG: enoyl-CoA hydratase-related protein [Gammaproteobacteria bacterium]
MTDELLESIEDGVAVLTLNRPERKNALNPSLMRALAEAVARVAALSEVGCVVLTGSGDAFCAGGDIKEHGQAERDRSAAVEREKSGGEKAERRFDIEHRMDWMRRCMEAPRILHDMPKPAIAMINGACAGAGMSLAAACDLRFAARSARFSLAFTKVGLSGDYGGSWFWTRILGTARARELYLLSEKIEADQALAMGLVNRLHPDEELRAATMEVARRLANGPRAAYRYAKANLNAAEDGTLESVFDLEVTHGALAGVALSNAMKSAKARKPG